jgi:hypothetical protein
MADFQGYQPRPAAAALMRVRGRGPRSHELRRLLDRWQALREKERDLIGTLGARHREYTTAVAEHDAALSDEDVAAATNEKIDPNKAERLDDKVQAALRKRTASVRRVEAFRPRLVEAEREADHFAQRHAAEIEAEMVPAVAKAELRFREAIARVGEAAQTFDDEVFQVAAVEGTLQAGEVVPSVLGGHVATMLQAIGRAMGEPLTRLPAGLQALAEESGMVTQGEVGAPIAANLPAPGGPRSMNELQQAQARRMGSVREVA